MKNIQRYRKYLILGCLTMVMTFTPTVVGAVFSNSSQTSIQIAQNSSTNNLADETQIKKVLLADAKAQNWQPEIGLITIANNYAIATVSDQVTGGESVLRKEQGTWKIVGGGGGAITKPEQLTNYFKVPLPTARRLLQIRASQQR